jgi:outer membrane lipoprotein
MRPLFLLTIALFFVAACAPAISRESMGLVDPGVTFEEVVRDPDRHVGRYLLIGGSIVSVRTMNDNSSELEVVQHPIDGRGRITATNRSAGRFLIRDDTFRDPAIYRAGRLITVVGQVEGSRPGLIGEFEYLYPVLAAHELRLWTPEDYPGASRTRFGIGIGIGISR